MSSAVCGVVLCLATAGHAVAWAAGGDVRNAGTLGLDDLVRQTLRGNRQLQVVSHQVRDAQGRVLQARGAFDPALSIGLSDQRNRSPLAESVQATPGRDQLRSDQLNMTASARKTLRSGVAVQGFVELSHLRDEGTLGFSSPGQALASVGFAVDIPLGRGAAVAGNERIAEFEHAAAEMDAGHQTAVVVQQAIDLYWALRADERLLDLARQIEARSQRLADQLRRLIEKDQVPASEMYLARASMADKMGQRIAAEQGLRLTRTQLDKLMGRDGLQDESAGATSDDFPAIRDTVESEDASAADLVTLARQRRLDLRAAQLRRQSVAEAVAQALDRARPDVTLSLGVRQSSLAGDSRRGELFQAVSGHWAGPSANVSLQYRWPVGGREADGAILSQHARLDSQTLRVDELNATIGLNVGDAFQAVRASAGLVRSADQAVEHYQAVVAAERRRYALGMSTLRNVLETEDRLDAAQQRSIGQRQEYARALTRLLFEAGELVVPEAGTTSGYRVLLKRLMGRELSVAPQMSGPAPYELAGP